MRLFTAITLPDNVRSELVANQPKHPEIRLTPETQLHLTLRFIGEMDKSRTRRIIQVLSGIAFRPFDITLKGTGCFPDPRSPYVLWTGVQYHPVLLELYDAVQTELSRAGVPQESRTYHPHVTIGRIKKMRDNKQPDENTLLGPVFENFLYGQPREINTTFHVDRFHLYHSRLHSGGAIHHCIQEYKGS